MHRPFDKLDFAETMEKYSEGVALVGPQIEILDCNETFRELTGIGEGPIQRFDSLVHPSYYEAWSSGLSRFLSDRLGKHRLILKLVASGMPDRWVRLSFLSLGKQDSSGAFLVQIADITGQKRLEMKLIHAKDEAEKATESKSEFLANTSHEIRTPIHTVIGMSELLNETSLDQEQKEYLGQIRFAADVLLTLINDILDFSKIEAGKLRMEMTEFDLFEMLEDATDLVTLEAHKKNVDIGLFIDQRVPYKIVGDPTRLRQVIINLINNAVKFTHEGQVVLDVETLDIDEEKVRLKFSVIDSGIGIEPEKQQHLFQAFHQADSSTTRRFGGTGLGLFISRSIVSQMSGNLSFSSEPGKGSTFFFELEFERADGGIKTPVIPEAFFGGRRVLVIDDNDTIRDRLGRILKAWGLGVDEAGGGREALFMMKSGSQPYELVIVDQTMPQMDGWQFASEVQSDPLLNAPRMILMSMKGGRGAVEAKMKLLGWFDFYLTKPFRQNELAAAVFRLLSRDMDLELAEELEELEELNAVEELSAVSAYRILIAEDHEVNRKLLQAILAKNGHEVLEAANGKEAWELAVREHPDLVFMDCQMPVMNGYQSTKNIRESGYEGPIIAVTASALAEERKKCEACGMDDLVTKPFKQVDILGAIERYKSSFGRPAAVQKPPASKRESAESAEIGDNSDSRASASSAGRVETASSSAAPPQPLSSRTPEGYESAYPDFSVFDYNAAVATFLGSSDTVKSLLKPLMTKMEDQLNELNRAFADGDFETIRTTGHAIKGSCRNMDMMRCGEAGAELENAGNAQDAEAARVGLERLSVEFPALQAEVKKILRS